MTAESPIVEFIEARLAEDEQTAQACLDAVGGSLKGDPWPDGEAGTLTRDDYPSYPWGSGEAELAYMARTRPARMLREVEAKRRIMEMHSVSDRLEYGDPLCTGCSDLYPCDTLRLLALPFSDHSGFDPSWIPDGDSSFPPLT